MNIDNLVYYHPFPMNGWYQQREIKENLINSQMNLCACCKNPLSEYPSLRHLDHNHDTGIVRGVVCPSCNSYIGKYEKGTMKFKWKTVVMIQRYLRNYDIPKDELTKFGERGPERIIHDSK